MIESIFHNLPLKTNYLILSSSEWANLLHICYASGTKPRCQYLRYLRTWYVRLLNMYVNEFHVDFEFNVVLYQLFVLNLFAIYVCGFFKMCIRLWPIECLYTRYYLQHQRKVSTWHVQKWKGNTKHDVGFSQLPYIIIFQVQFFIT